MSTANDPTLRLANAHSPFLRHGATQPVDWLPWGEAAFERARRDDRPILLDIGAVWCHWCHVMDRESYEDEQTAALINELFVPVKVDRDERPDVDARYQRAIQTLSGQGGWPLTAFLTPDGRAFYGGTYFPPADMQGRPSFRRVLGEIARIWREDRERAIESATHLRAHLESTEAGLRQPGELDAALVDHCVNELAQSFDIRHGGFGGAPKFPNAGAVLLLLDRWIEARGDWARRVVAETLHAMARGGIYDQLGGGFHRYSVDERWIIPHFEKMASDNGALLECYARAAAALEDSFLADVARGSIRYYREIAPELSREGGFPASQDADVDADDDGDYWTWTEEEVMEAAGGEERLASAGILGFGIDQPESAMPTAPERHVLRLARSPREIASRIDGADADEAGRRLDRIARRMKRLRDGRPRPFVDTTVFADWTALVASGHLAAFRYLVDADARETALRALERIWKEGFDDGVGIRHRIGDTAAGHFLSDQAFTLAGTLDAFEITQRSDWMQRARTLADLLVERFADPDGGGFLDRPRDADPTGALDLPHRPITDAPEPSGNAVAALALLRLEALGDAGRYGDVARRTLAAFAGAARTIATGAVTYFRALDWATGPVTTVVVVANGAADDDTLFATALRTPRPRTVIRRLSPDAIDAAGLPGELRAMLSAEPARAYVCVGTRCFAPVATPEALAELLVDAR